jgi:hypothetical protein
VEHQAAGTARNANATPQAIDAATATGTTSTAERPPGGSRVAEASPSPLIGVEA